MPSLHVGDIVYQSAYTEENVGRVLEALKRSAYSNWDDRHRDALSSMEPFDLHHFDELLPTLSIDGLEEDDPAAPRENRSSKQFGVPFSPTSMWPLWVVAMTVGTQASPRIRLICSLTSSVLSEERHERVTQRLDWALEEHSPKLREDESIEVVFSYFAERYQDLVWSENRPLLHEILDALEAALPVDRVDFTELRAL